MVEIAKWPTSVPCRPKLAEVKRLSDEFEGLIKQKETRYGYTGKTLDVGRYIEGRPPMKSQARVRYCDRTMIIFECSEGSRRFLADYREALVTLGEVMDEFESFDFAITGFVGGGFWVFKSYSDSWPVARGRLCSLEAKGPDFDFDYTPLVPETRRESPDLIVTIAHGSPPASKVKMLRVRHQSVILAQPGSSTSSHPPSPEVTLVSSLELTRKLPRVVLESIG